MGEQKEGILHGGVKMNDEQEGPLEIQILRNVEYVDIGRARMWCDSVVIDPPCNILPHEQRQVRGFSYGNGKLKHVFTRFYFPNEPAEYKSEDDTGKFGILTVAGEEHKVWGKRNAGIINETKTFVDGHTELWEYLTRDE